MCYNIRGNHTAAEILECATVLPSFNSRYVLFTAIEKVVDVRGCAYGKYHSREYYNLHFITAFIMYSKGFCFVAVLLYLHNTTYFSICQRVFSIIIGFLRYFVTLYKISLFCCMVCTKRSYNG